MNALGDKPQQLSSPYWVVDNRLPASDAKKFISPLRSPSGTLASLSSDPQAKLQEQAIKLADLWQKFLNAGEYSPAPGSTKILENVKKHLGVMCSLLRANANTLPAHQKEYHLLLAEALQLSCLSEMYLQNYGSAMAAAREAERIARHHEAYDLALVSVLRQCQIERCLGHIRVMYSLCHRSCDLFGYTSSPLVQSHFLFVMAEAQASVGLASRDHRATAQMALNLHPMEPGQDQYYSCLQDAQLRTSAARYHLATGDITAALTDLGVHPGQFDITGNDFYSLDAQSVLADVFVEHENADYAIAATIALLHKARVHGSLLLYSRAQYLYESLVESSFVSHKSEQLSRLARLVSC